MNKPIIGAQGEILTPMKRGTAFYIKLGFNGVEVTERDVRNGHEYTETPYITRKAAEMALIRAKCIQRLKVMAYGGGWLPTQLYGQWVIVLDYGKQMHCQLPVYFANESERDKALNTITPAEREALLYIYKPEEAL